MDSILTSVKKFLGAEEDYEHFDQDIIMHINAAFGTLTQLGVGPEDGFSISGKDTTWHEYVSDNTTLNLVKQYIFTKVKVVFDPPQSSFVLEAYNKTIDELTWRLNVEVDPSKQ